MSSLITIYVLRMVSVISCVISLVCDYESYSQNSYNDAL